MPEQTDYNGFSLEINEISTITFNMSHGVNILSTPVIIDFVRAIDRLSFIKEVKVLIITGSGNTFLAGADIKEMAEFDAKEAEKFARLIHNAMNIVEKFPRPVIAAVNGFALGGGCELALACDIILASEAAVFAQPEVNLGIIPGAGGTQRLAGRIGREMAKELIFTGRRVQADEAFDLRLVNRVVPKDELSEEVMTLARLIAQKPLQCIEAAKKSIDSCSFETEIEEFTNLFNYDDRKNLMNKFLKR
ncbi:MAG: enoyl-CoA hydratase/isomerase family protein [Deltaproteobacteria bacterium]|nr:enoyl-CoA hydratase/isomerase family protein [Deltaproteobacteria bacterium]